MTADVPRSVLFLDNGGDSIKALYLAGAATAGDDNSSGGGVTASSSSPPTTNAAADLRPRWLCIPNCVGAASYAGRGIVGEQIHTLPHYHGFMVRRPVTRGFVVDGLLQAHIWEYVLQYFGIDVEERVELWLTLPHGAPRAVASLLSVLVTQRFHFYSLTCVSSSFLALLAHEHAARVATRRDTACAHAPSTCSGGDDGGSESTHGDEQQQQQQQLQGTALVVDVGFSSTTVVPYVSYMPVYSSIVRADMGGKVLTNRLKEHLSFTQVNVMEDGWLVNYIKEQCCAVARNPRAMLARYERTATSARAAKTMTSTRAAVAARQHAKRNNNNDNNDNDDDNSSCDSDDNDGDEEQHMTDVPQTSRSSAASVDEVLHYYLPTVPALYPLGCLGHDAAATRLGVDRSDNNNDTMNVNAKRQGRRDTTTDSDDDDDDDEDKSGAAGERRATSDVVARMQSIRLAHERFLVPELLFTPGDVGSRQRGLVDALTHGVFARGLLKCLPLLHPTLLSRVFVYGGSCNFDNFMQRLRHDVRATLSSDGPHGRLYMPDPVRVAYRLRRAYDNDRDATTMANKSTSAKATTTCGKPATTTRKRARGDAKDDDDDDSDNSTNATTRDERHEEHKRNRVPSVPAGILTSAQLLPLYGAQLLLTDGSMHALRERVRQRSSVVFKYTRSTRVYDDDIQHIVITML